jgi:hypothetical protein
MSSGLGKQAHSGRQRGMAREAVGRARGPVSRAGVDPRRRAPRRTSPQHLLGSGALAGFALACGWTLCINLTGAPDTIVAGAAATTIMVADAAPQVDAGFRADRLAAPRPAETAADIAAALFDSRFTAGFPAGSDLKRTLLAATEPLAVPETPPPGAAPTHTASPSPRIAALRQPQTRKPAPSQVASVQVASAQVASAAPAQPTLFQKLFGRSENIFEKLFGKPQSPAVALAYAPSDGGVASDASSLTTGRYDRQTAVYDISAHMVYLPDGTTLEAHSGLGGLLDDPSHTDAKDRGATPATIYNLEPREAPFHGVKALRLIPVDEDKVFGRSGLLAHSFMLGPNGDSNGCVSFRDYDAFLRAYDNHLIKRLAVVTRID